MNEVNDPERLSLRAAQGSLLERGLAMARDRGPSDAELRALGASLFGGAAAGIGAAGTGAAAKAGSAGWLTAGLTKAATALVITGAVAGLTTVTWRRTSALRPDRHLSAPSVTAPRPAREPQQPVIVPLAQPPVTPAIAPKDRWHPRAVVAPHAQPVAPPDEPAPSPPAVEQAGANADEELRLLGAAQGALPRDPTRALALVREHERRYPEGLLSQEREAVAVSALLEIGHRDEARRRAERFAQEHPGSTYVGRMRQILTQTGSTAR